MDLLKNEILPLVEQAAEGLGLDASMISRVLQPARELDQGDLSLPCFPFAKTLGMAPASIAEQLAEAIPPHPSLEKHHRRQRLPQPSSRAGLAGAAIVGRPPSNFKGRAS